MSDNSKILKLAKLKKYDSSKFIGMSFEKNRKMNSCGDWCEVSIATIEPKVDNIQFSHRGCMLSRAVMNAVIESIRNKTRLEALGIINLFRSVINYGKMDSNLPDKLKLFSKFSEFPTRKKCILVVCNEISRVLNEQTGI